ncbi:MAG: Ldh family oxidoreductase [Treponema sp.]|nr:Ldh family oxidoreductase [Treponema sp.]
MSLTVDAEKTKDLVSLIFVRSGLNEKDARLVAENLVQAEMRGIRSHGLVQVANYSTFMRNGKINVNAAIKTLSESDSAISFDADFAPGAVAGRYAMAKTIEKAQKTGVAVSTVKNATHFGFAAFYAQEALKHDLIGLAFTSSSLLVAPFGGFERVLGTNPICVAVPALHERPVIFDAATSNAAYNKSFFAYTEGRKIPRDWGMDAHGNPTENPADIVKNGGALFPFGSYKGYGLDFIVYLLTAVLGGSAIGRNENGVFEDAGKIGYNFAAIDISKFADAESFKQTVDFAVRRIRSSKKAAGSERIYVPGEIEAELYEKARTDGLVLYDGVAGEISRTLGELGITESLDSVKK